MKSTVFWDIMTCSSLKVNPEDRGDMFLQNDFQRTTWRYITEDSTLHNHHCDNLRSYIELEMFVHIIGTL
jgi:hypothetical protein